VAVKDFIEGRALRWVGCENALDELFAVRGDGTVDGEVVLVVADSSIRRCWISTG
jgi:hypothetical protein